MVDDLQKQDRVCAEIGEETGQYGFVKALDDERVTLKLDNNDEIVVIRDSVRKVRTAADDFREKMFASDPFPALLRMQARHIETRAAAGLSNNLRIAWLPHQILHARAFLKKEHPRMLIADDTGLGKTVTAGLILWLLHRQNRLHRALILVRANATFQWETELGEKFGFENLPVRVFGHVVNSLDSLQNDGIFISSYEGLLKRWRSDQQQIQELEWDIVVADEAHKLLDPQSKSHQMVRDLTWRSRNRPAEEGLKALPAVLFLSATPYRGSAVEFFRLLDLLNPVFFSEAEREKAQSKARKVFEQRGGDLRSLVRRTRKFFCVDASGDMDKNFFSAPAQRKTIKSGGLPREAKKALRRYFALLGDCALTKEIERAAQSSYARLLEKLHNRYEELKEDMEKSPPEYEKVRKLGTLEVRNRLFKKLPFVKQEKVTEDSRPEEFDALESVLSKLPAEQQLMETPDKDPKWETFCEELPGIFYGALQENTEGLTNTMSNLVDRLRADNRVRQPREMVIFSSYDKTFDFLKNALEKEFPGDVIALEGTPDERRNILEQFRGSKPILLCRPNAEESLNLQNAEILVHYDVPENLFIRYQRLGRLHRLTQTQNIIVVDVHGPSIERDRLQEWQEQLEEQVKKVVAEMPEDVKDRLSVEDRREQARIELTMPLQGVGLKNLEGEPQDMARRAFEAWEEMNEIMPGLPPVSKQELGVLPGDFDPTESARSVKTFVMTWQKVYGGSLEEADQKGAYRLRLGKPDGLWKDADVPSLVVFDKDYFTEAQELPVFAPGHPVLDKMLEWALNENQHDGCAVMQVPGKKHDFWERVQDIFGAKSLYYLLTLVWKGDTSNVQDEPGYSTVVLDEDWHIPEDAEQIKSFVLGEEVQNVCKPSEEVLQYSREQVEPVDVLAKAEKFVEEKEGKRSEGGEYFYWDSIACLVFGD